MGNLRELLKISEDRLNEVNDLLTDPTNETVGQILAIVDKYGGPQEINRKAAEACKFENLMTRLKEIESPYVAEVEWLAEQRDKQAFVSMADYYDRILGDRGAGTAINQDNAVTLEISALQFFPWLIAEAKQALVPLLTAVDPEREAIQWVERLSPGDAERVVEQACREWDEIVSGEAEHEAYIDAHIEAHGCWPPAGLGRPGDLDRWLAKHEADGFSQWTQREDSEGRQVIVLIERTARENIRQRDKGLDKFMPNRKDVSNPRTENLLASFQYVVSGETVLPDGDRYGFVSELTDLQEDILSILEVPPECFSYDYLFDTG